MTLSMRMKYTIAMMILIRLLLYAVSAEAGLSKAVYIDPFFDDEHVGIAPSDKGKAEGITKKIANALKAHLEKRNYAVNLPGEAEAIAGFEDRLSISEKKKSSLYILISLSVAKNNCIAIYYPQFEKKVYKKPADADKSISDEVYNSIGNSFKKEISDDSGKLANLLVKKIHEHSVENCVDASANNSYLLMIASYPMIILDYNLKDIDKLPVYLVSDAALNKMINAIGDAIDEYYLAHHKAQ